MSDTGPPVLAPGPWLRVHADGTASVLIDRSEMGQGVVTALSMLVAEELEIELGRIRTEFAPAGPDYANAMLDEQVTGGSTSIRAAWEPLREEGAAARTMLVGAAARRWGVAATECRAQDGVVVHPASGRRLEYGDLVSEAATEPVPEHPALKPPDELRLLGRRLARLDIPDMVRGRTEYGSDVRVPGLRFAAIARCPVPGGRVRDFDAAEARGMPGVRDVLALDHSVAVVADETGSAIEGRDRLSIEWDEGALAELSTEGVRRQLARASKRRGRIARDQGNARKALERAGRVVEAVYETPYLAHACMEPMNCTARVDADGCDVWVPTQAQQETQTAAARIAGLEPERVRVHTTFLGGGFGRRAETDFVEEAVELARRTDEPIQVIWTRADDMRHDFYRPASCTRLAAGLNDAGSVSAWHQRIAGPALAHDGVRMRYAIPNVREEHVESDPGLPTGAWRSVGASQNAFCIEGFVDELAHETGTDPLEFRLALLPDQPRARRVLETAARAAGWASPPAGRHQGIAFYHAFGSLVAQVAEISVRSGQEPRVHRVVCAIDCGMTVNPDTIEAQMEGAVVFALSAALYGEITLANGRVQQSSFTDYPVLTLSETPDIDVHIVPSAEAPGGVGEPGVPPLAPALTNALFAATGVRVRKLPIRKEARGTRP